MKNKRFVTTLSELKEICKKKKQELLASEIPERKVNDVRISIPIVCIEDWQYIIREDTSSVQEASK